MSDFPIRCFTCNKVISRYYRTYEKKIEEGVPVKIILDNMGITRLCCRTAFIGFVPIVDNLNTDLMDTNCYGEL